MTPWYRIFGRTDQVPAPADIEACLTGAGPFFSNVFADETGWYRAEIRTASGPTLVLERWLADEEGIRAELNSWAAFLETCEHSFHSRSLMEQVIQSRQLITLSAEGDSHRLCTLLCQLLARTSDGFYQVDDEGFFSADGDLLVRTS